MKPSPPNKPTPILLLKCNADLDAPRSAKERSLLTNQFASHLVQMHRRDPSHIRSRKRDMFAALSRIRKRRHKQRLARQHSFARADDFVPEPTAAARVPEDGLHFNSRSHVHHRTCFGDDSLSRIQRDLDVLRVVAVNAVVDLVPRSLVCQPAIDTNAVPHC